MAMRLTMEQLQKMDKSPRVDFHFRAIGFLREQLAEQTERMDDIALLQRVQESESRAGKYGVASEAGVMQWACLTFLAGAKFDDMPEVNAFLREPAPGGEEKLEQLVNSLDEQFQGGHA